MNYLERNVALIAEINDEIQHGLKFEKQWVASSRSGTQYSTMGSYDSKVAGKTVYLGYKEYKHTDPELSTAMTLAIIRTITETIPEYEEEIPILHGRLSHIEEGEKGLLVEDVSEGGRVGVKEVNEYSGKREGFLPEKLRLINPELDDEELAVASFHVGEKRMLLDLLGMRSGLMPDELIDTFPFFDIYEDIESHTVYTSQKV